MATAATVDSERDLECPVCQELFRKPKMLPCGHTVCLDPCLQQLAKDKDTVRCPECRAKHEIPKGGVDQFPSNIFIIRLMDTKQGKKLCEKAPDTSVCPVCDSAQVQLIKCFHCRLMVCEECRMSHTTEILKNTASVIAELKVALTSLAITDIRATANVKLADNVTDLEASLDIMFEPICSAIQERKNQLKVEIQQYAKEKRQAIDTSTDVLNIKVNEALQFCDDEINTSLSQSKILQIQQECRRHHGDVCKPINDVTMMSQAEITFDDNVVLEALGKLGKVVTSHDVIADKAKDDDIISIETATQTDVLPKESASETNVLRIKPTTKQQYSLPVVSSLPPPPSLKDRDIGKVKKCVGRRGDAPGLFNQPTAVAVSPATGNIIVADVGNKRVQIFDENAEFLLVVTNLSRQNRQFTRLHDIAVNHMSEIYILDINTVHVYTERGKYLRVFQVPSSSVSLAVDDQQRIHVCCGKEGVYVYNASGKIITTYGIIAAQQIDARKIAIGSRIHIVSMRITGDNVYYDGLVFNNELQFLFKNKIYVNMEQMQQFPSECRVNAICEQNNVLVVTHLDSSYILILDGSFRVLKAFGKEGPGIHQLYKPRGVAITRKGDIVVVGENDFMQIF